MKWFRGGTIYVHLGVTILETALSFLVGGAFATAFGVALAVGLSPPRRQWPIRSSRT